MYIYIPLTSKLIQALFPLLTKKNRVREKEEKKGKIILIEKQILAFLKYLKFNFVC